MAYRRSTSTRVWPRWGKRRPDATRAMKAARRPRIAQELGVDQPAGGEAPRSQEDGEDQRAADGDAGPAGALPRRLPAPVRSSRSASCAVGPSERGTVALTGRGPPDGLRPAGSFDELVGGGGGSRRAGSFDELVGGRCGAWAHSTNSSAPGGDRPAGLGRLVGVDGQGAARRAPIRVGDGRDPGGIGRGVVVPVVGGPALGPEGRAGRRAAAAAARWPSSVAATSSPSVRGRGPPAPPGRRGLRRGLAEPGLGADDPQPEPHRVAERGQRRLELGGDLGARRRGWRRAGAPSAEAPVVHAPGRRRAGVAGRGLAGAVAENLRLGHRIAVQAVAAVDAARGLAARVEAGEARAPPSSISTPPMTKWASGAMISGNRPVVDAVRVEALDHLAVLVAEHLVGDRRTSRTTPPSTALPNRIWSKMPRAETSRVAASFRTGS